MKNWIRHWGIYGLALKKDRVLVIHKTRGPYTGRYDLPGGTINCEESLLDHLRREFIEETGHAVRIKKMIGACDFLVEEPDRILHHVALLYRVEIIEKIANVEATVVTDGTIENNDSSGSTWILKKKLNIANSSPLLIAALNARNSTATEMSRLSQWVRLGD